jgi:DNA polymerase-3 subunit alpha
MEYIPLQVASEYSLLESSCRIDRLVKKAKELNLKAIALTDHNVMYGVIPFYKVCKAQGIKPIIGLKVNVKLGTEANDTAQLVLLAKDQTGYQNLLKISSRIMLNTKEAFQELAISEAQLKKYSEGLIAISTGLKGVAQRFLIHNKREIAGRTIQRYQTMFASGFYLGLQDHGLAEEKTLNLEVINSARQFDIELVVTQDIYYLDEGDAFAHECLLCIKSGVKITDPKRPRMKSEQHFFKAPQDIINQFTHIPEAIENTSKIAEMCNVDITLGKYVLPRYPLEGDTDSTTYLRKLCEKGLKVRYSRITDEIKERLDYELFIINKMGFNDYLLIVWDFMDYSHKNNIMTGPGRGSAAGSIVAYLLRITDVDPIEHDLLFERFLNPERVSMPDIDIDFPDNRREEVIQYVMKKYGSMHVAQIITFGTLAARSAIRDVGRVLGTDNKLVDKLAKLIPSGVTLGRAYKESKEFRSLIQQNSKADELFKIAETIEGLPRHASTHAAGVVMSEEPLPNTVALQSGHEGVPLTQFDMEAVEDVGLLKMDFLGLRNLSLLEGILQLVKDATGKEVHLDDIPYNDPKTFDLLSKGDTTGIFQLESDGMRRVLQRLKPNCFEDIVAVNALYRPGPMENIPIFIKGKNESDTVEYPLPDLKPILERTYGVIVYQEQIIQIASKMAGFSLGEADLLRRAVAKKKREILDQERVHFIKGANSLGYLENDANRIYDLIVQFANYGFNRSHAVAYSVISYRLAYLKANYPLFFMASLLSSTITHAGKVAQYIQECKQKQIIVRPPSINKSSFLFSVVDDGIRVGLLMIKNVGASAVQEIVHARSQKPFQDLFDFCTRISVKTVNQRVIETLILAGCFDEFGYDRATLLASLEHAMEYGVAYQKQENDSQIGLFIDEMKKPNYTEVPPFGEMESLNFEKEAIGLYLTGHPIEKYRELLSYYECSLIGGIIHRPDHTVRVSGMVNKSRVIKTKKGDLMAFVQISDETGDIDVVVFPSLYKSTSALYEEGKLLFIEGKVEQEETGYKLIAQKTTATEQLNKPKEMRLFLKINTNENKKQILEEVKKILQAHPGKNEVYLFYEDKRQTIKLDDQYLVHISKESLLKLKTLLGNENVVTQIVG